MPYINWSIHEQYVRDNIDKKTPQEIADELGVRLYDLGLYIHRERIFPVKTTPKNIAYEVIKLKFVHPEYFRPTRKFYRAVGMTQRQWWASYRGERKITEEEYKKLVEHLGVTLPEAFELRQISLNFEDHD